MFRAGHGDASNFLGYERRRPGSSSSFTLMRQNVLGAGQGPSQLGRQPGIDLDGRVAGGCLAGFGKRLRWRCRKGASDAWQELARPERDESEMDRHGQVLQALRVQRPLGELIGGYASRDGLVVGHNCLSTVQDSL